MLLDWEKEREEQREEGKKEGIQKGIREIVQKMVQSKESDDKIIKYTGISKEELKNIKEA